MCLCVYVCLLDSMSQLQTVFIVIGRGEQRTQNAHTKPHTTQLYITLNSSLTEHVLVCVHTNIAAQYCKHKHKNTGQNIMELTVSYPLLPHSANQYSLYWTHTSLAMSCAVYVFGCVSVWKIFCMSFCDGGVDQRHAAGSVTHYLSDSCFTFLAHISFK